MNYIENTKNVESIEVISNIQEKKEIILSIVIPTFNRQKTVADILTSIRLQKCISKNWEVLLVDNYGEISNQTSTYKIAESFKDLPLRYFQNTKNIGMASNWNRCVELANGKWVFMIHTDDLMVEGTIQYLLSIVQHYGSVFKFFFTARKTCLYREDDDIKALIENDNHKNGRIKKYDSLDIVLGIALNAPTGMVLNKKAFIDLGGFNNIKSAFALDVDFNLRAMEKYHVAGLTRKCVIKREGENDTKTSTELYRLSWVNSILELYDASKIFPYKIQDSFFYRMRIVEMAEWASVPIEKLTCGKIKYNQVGMIVYKIIRKLRRGAAFQSV